MEPRPPLPTPPLSGEESQAWPGPGAPLVFAGCGQTDVALAKAFWNSVTLQPPLESSLGPRRTSGGGGAPSGAAARRDSGPVGAVGSRRSLLDAQKNGPLPQASATSRKVEAGTQEDPETEKVVDDKARYLQKAKRREEILALLKKQREDRIMKEAISRPHKPKAKMEESKLTIAESDIEDQESVRALI